MNRQYLKNGIEIKLENDTFEIVKSIGEGANCVVYEAIKKKNDYEYKYYLKECYPYNIDITRNVDGSLKWADEDVKEKSLKNFENEYRTLLKIYANEYFTNSTSIPVEIYEANDTIYILNDIKTGSTFKDDNTENLSDILATIIALSKLIGKYHEEGYLHLDIKPENMFLLEETRELVVLFDVDSVVSIDALKMGEVKRISYSENYAAPEQRDGNFSEINEKTDICSIGATLFYKIIGRYVRALDRGIFSDWDFDNNIFFQNINPQIKKHIKDIFHKTLAVKNKNRYENTDELIKALEAAKKVCDEEIYLKSNCPMPVKGFVGRKKELEDIHDNLYKNRTVFLSGIGGIGKSELAKKYAHEYKNNYDVILFFRYNQSLKELINCINIHGYVRDSEDSFKDKEKLLQRLLNEKTLLIIDNFDVTNDEYLSELIEKYNCKKIITTRTDFSKKRNTVSINVNELSNDELEKLFEKNYSYELTEEDSVALNNILRMVGDLTLCIPILAQQCVSSNITVMKLEEKLSAGLIELDRMENVDAYKDCEAIEDITVPKFLKAVFGLANLKPKEKKVLRNLSLLSFIYVDKEEYEKIALYGVAESKHTDAFNSINRLVKKNLVKKSIVGKDTFYELHPLIDELVRYELKCNYKNCKEVFSYVENYSKVIHIPSELPMEMRFSGDESVVSEYINREKLRFVDAFVDNFDKADETTMQSLKKIISNSKGKDEIENFNISCRKHRKTMLNESSLKSFCVDDSIVDDISDEWKYYKVDAISIFLKDIMMGKDIIKDFDIEWFRKFVGKIQRLFCFKVYIRELFSDIDVVDGVEQIRYEIRDGEGYTTDWEVWEEYFERDGDIIFEFYDDNNEISINEIIHELLENFISKIPDDCVIENWDYGTFDEMIISELFYLIAFNRETDNCIETVRKVFEYYFEKNKHKIKLFDLKVLGYACAELVCGNDDKFNEYMDIIIDNAKKDIKGMDFDNLTNSNHPLIYYFELQEFEEMLSVIFSYNPKKIKLLLPFYHKLILFFEDYLSELSNYKEIMCICYAMTCYGLSMHKLMNRNDKFDLTYKKILDECQQKLNKLIEAKRFK